MVAPVKKKRIGGTEKRADLLLNHACKCCIKLAFAAGTKDNNLFSERGGCLLCGSHFEITVRVVWIHEKSDADALRHNGMQQL